MRWFLALSSAVVVVIGLTVVLHDRLDAGTGAGDQVVGDGSGALPGGDGGTTGADDTSSGNIEVSGKITSIHLERAVIDPQTVKTPLTISSDRGFGNGGELTGVSVGGKDSSVVWDGGRPFVLSSGPGIQLDPVTVDLADGKVRCTLGGSSSVVVAGSYQLDTPVAVGGTGIATPRDSVAFTAGPHAHFEAHGDAALLLGGDTPHTFTGPGLVQLVGDLVVNTEEGEQGATSLDLRSGPFELTLSPTSNGGWTVSGHVQSKVVGDLKLGRLLTAGRRWTWPR
jgi:hypothetical protein